MISKNGYRRKDEIVDREDSVHHLTIHSLIKGLERAQRVIYNEPFVNPLDDEAFQQLADITEKTDGEHPKIVFNIKRVLVDTNCRLYPDQDKASSITDVHIKRVGLRESKEFDVDYFNRLVRRFEGIYPKTIDFIRVSK